jgi:hypothetical protein
MDPWFPQFHDIVATRRRAAGKAAITTTGEKAV